jgi:PAS domain S-box-containing protein
MSPGETSNVPDNYSELKKRGTKKRRKSAERSFALAYDTGYDGKQSLAAASRPLAALVKIFDEFLFELDSDGRFLGVWSSSQTLKTGHQMDFIGRHAMEVLGEETFLPFSELFHRVIATRQSDGIEFPVDLEDGRHWFYASVLPVARRSGKAPSVSLVAHDVTLKKETEDKLRKSEALLAQAEQLVNMGIWEVDTVRRTVLGSDNLFRILGYDYRGCEIEIPKIAEHVHTDDAVEAQKRLEAAVRDGIPFEHDFRCTLPERGLRHLRARVFLSASLKDA